MRQNQRFYANRYIWNQFGNRVPIDWICNGDNKRLVVADRPSIKPCCSLIMMGFSWGLESADHRFCNKKREIQNTARNNVKYCKFYIQCYQTLLIFFFLIFGNYLNNNYSLSINYACMNYNQRSHLLHMNIYKLKMVFHSNLHDPNIHID